MTGGWGKSRANMPKQFLSLTSGKTTERAGEVPEREFTAFHIESIDYSVMEKARDIYILSGPFGWDDVGSWLAVGRINKSNEFGNVINGNVLTVEAKDCVIRGGRCLIAAVGMENVIVVDTDDAILICGKDSAGEPENLQVK